MLALVGARHIVHVSRIRVNVADDNETCLVLCVKYPIFLSDFIQIENFWTDFLQESIRPAGATLVHAGGRAEGQADITKLVGLQASLQTRLETLKKSGERQ